MSKVFANFKYFVYGTLALMLVGLVVWLNTGDQGIPVPLPGTPLHLTKEIAAMYALPNSGIVPKALMPAYDPEMSTPGYTESPHVYSIVVVGNPELGTLTYYWYDVAGAATEASGVENTPATGKLTGLVSSLVSSIELPPAIATFVIGVPLSIAIGIWRAWVIYKWVLQNQVGGVVEVTVDHVETNQRVELEGVHVVAWYVLDTGAEQKRRRGSMTLADIAAEITKALRPLVTGLVRQSPAGEEGMFLREQLGRLSPRAIPVPPGFGIRVYKIAFGGINFSAEQERARQMVYEANLEAEAAQTKAKAGGGAFATFIKEARSTGEDPSTQVHPMFAALAYIVNLLPQSLFTVNVSNGTTGEKPNVNP